MAPDSWIDHLVLAAPDLEAGMRHVGERLGVRPVLGGRHPRWGTRNALLALGPRTYLEVVASDPKADRPERGRLFGVDTVESPRLVTWALGVAGGATISARAERAAAAGVRMGAFEEGSRETPDGTLLTWKLTDPYAMPFGGAVPFLIDWGETPHPAAAAPAGEELAELRIEHPDPTGVRTALRALGADSSSITIDHGARPRLLARIGTIVLGGPTDPVERT